MIFIFFTIIIFIAELIIASALIKWLICIDMKINRTSIFITKANITIGEIMVLCRRLSEQILEFSPIIVEKIKSIRSYIIWELAERLVSLIVFLGVNIKMYRKLKRKKFKKWFSWV